MKLILTRNKAGIVTSVELDDVHPDGVGRVELPNILAVQITDKAMARPIVGIEIGTYEGFELVQITEGKS